MAKAVVGIVKTTREAENLVEELERGGFARKDLSVLLPDQSGTRDFAHEQNTKAPEGAVTGVSAGGVLGGTLGLLAGIGALAIPGLGPFVAAGPIMAALSGAAAGAAVGGVAGALIGLGIPELEAKQYEGKLREGNVLISVHAEDSDAAKRAKTLMERNGVKDVSTAGETSVPSERGTPSTGRTAGSTSSASSASRTR